MNPVWMICWLAVASDPAPLTIDSALLTIAEQAEVPARDAGVVSEVAIREGQIVKVGDPLVHLEDADARLGHVKALIDVQRAKKLASNDIKLRLAQKDLEFANTEYQRATQSEGKLPGSVSEAERDRLRLSTQRAALELEQAEFDLEAAKLAVNLFENELRLAEEKLQRRRILAPISGVVVAIPKRLGEWVEPGQVVVRVLATDKLRVEFFLKSDQATPDLVGKTVRFTPPNATENSASFAGKVAFVSPEVDPLNGQVRVWAEIDNRDGRLRPGLAGALAIIR